MKTCSLVFGALVALICFAPAHSTACGYGHYGQQVVAPVVVQPAQIVVPPVAQVKVAPVVAAPVVAAPVVQQVVQPYVAPLAVTGGYGAYGYGVSGFRAPVVVRQRAFLNTGIHGGYGGFSAQVRVAAPAIRVQSVRVAPGRVIRSRVIIQRQRFLRR